jgi:hypothetical protein
MATKVLDVPENSLARKKTLAQARSRQVGSSVHNSAADWNGSAPLSA